MQKVRKVSILSHKLNFRKMSGNHAIDIYNLILDEVSQTVPNDTREEFDSENIVEYIIHDLMKSVVAEKYTSNQEKYRFIEDILVNCIGEAIAFSNDESKKIKPLEVSAEIDDTIELIDLDSLNDEVVLGENHNEAEILDKDEDLLGMSTELEEAVIVPAPFLRLKDFAVDPANNMISDQAPTIPAIGSWHSAQGVPQVQSNSVQFIDRYVNQVTNQPEVQLRYGHTNFTITQIQQQQLPSQVFIPMQPGPQLAHLRSILKMNFKFASKELHYKYVLCARNKENHFAILTLSGESREEDSLKVFVPWDLLTTFSDKVLENDTVDIHESDIIFKSRDNMTKSVTNTKKITNLDEFEATFLDNTKIFSMAGSQCIEMFQSQAKKDSTPFLRYAIDTSKAKHEIMAVDLTDRKQKKPFAVPFFRYLSKAVQKNPENEEISQDIRGITEERISVLFDLLAKSDGRRQALMIPMTLEDEIFKRSSKIEVYQTKIIQYLKTEVLKRSATFPYNLDKIVQPEKSRPIIKYTCVICDEKFTADSNHQKDVMQKRDEHMVNAHFYARLTKLVAKYDREKTATCPFDSQCKIKMDMMTQEQLILHVAIDHKLIDNFNLR